VVILENQAILDQMVLRVIQATQERVILAPMESRATQDTLVLENLVIVVPMATLVILATAEKVTRVILENLVIRAIKEIQVIPAPQAIAVFLATRERLRVLSNT